ncbi:endonuclease/exonuclease/phosphatase family protein [Occultella kanbiaonis]|uniref:endonuclease/exonuclease/phosphatase family protein n=1 Tax=Occultella kanbiaonis TaxID=2675754 RepID=UPI0012B9AA28|nr:endonuclease/exonuclease/phosphatase family protein [Occultella kanbiaonis]
MRIGTWNVENLFTPGTGYGPTERSVFEEKVAGLAATITAAELDVVAVQEIGDEEAFTALTDALGGDWAGELSVMFQTPHTIRTGILTRLPIAGSSEHSLIPPRLQGVPIDDESTPLTAMGRGALHVRVTAPDGTGVDVVTVHLKSKLISYPGRRFTPRDEGERARFAAYALYRRAAEAVAVRAFADELLDGAGNDRHLVVAGDFNDEPQAATTQIIQGPTGSEIGTPGEERPDQGDAHRLFNLAPLIPEDERFSRVYRGRGELIDHLFVSNASRKIVTEAGTRTGGESLESVADTPTARRDSPFSDHALVTATFNL